MWRFVKDIFDYTNIFGMTSSTPFPVFTQGVHLLTGSADPTINMINGTNITIYSTKNGQTTQVDYASLNASVVIAADANTDIIVTGNLTGLFDMSNGDWLTVKVLNTGISLFYTRDCPVITEIDVQGEQQITEIDCQNCADLTTLNMYGCDGLTTLTCTGCPDLIWIVTPAQEFNVALAVANAITAANAANGILQTNSADTYYNVVESAANNKGWTVIAD